jgi:CBS domain-containing protein
MIAEDIMKKAVATGAPDSDLASIVDVIPARDCGFRPVVDTHGIVVGLSSL